MARSGTGALFADRERLPLRLHSLVASAKIVLAVGNPEC
ncbi:hypothetical protein LEUCIP111803_02394 [Leucobacter soli]|uniref:Uncharacterized protein n=1 Tax=Leucobacter soli TaxID=2812850 RepID=A0A916NPI8_9MICO|nr:hypothetical protein LEUCIP111803_02394 [Leucobacter soli]